MSEIGKLVKQLAINAVNSTSPSDLMLGEVVSPLPNLQIKLRDQANMIIPKELLVVNRELLNYKRTVNIVVHPSKATQVRIQSANVTESMSSAGSTPHTHDISSITLDNSSLTVVDAQIQFTDELKIGDIVMLESFSGGQMFYVSAIVKTFE